MSIKGATSWGLDNVGWKSF